MPQLTHLALDSPCASHIGPGTLFACSVPHLVLREHSTGLGATGEQPVGHGFEFGGAQLDAMFYVRPKSTSLSMRQTSQRQPPSRSGLNGGLMSDKLA